MTAHLPLYIDRSFRAREARDCGPIYDPATGEVIGEQAHATRADRAGRPTAVFTPWNFPALTPARKLAAVSRRVAPSGIMRLRKSPKNARAAIRGLQFGMVRINSLAISSPETPFGGINHSGHGQEGGPEGLHAYLNIKLVAQA